MKPTPMSAYKNYHGKASNPMDESKAHESRKGDMKQDAGEYKKKGKSVKSGKKSC